MDERWMTRLRFLSRSKMAETRWPPEFLYALEKKRLSSFVKLHWAEVFSDLVCGSVSSQFLYHYWAGRDEPVNAVSVGVIYGPIDMVLFTFTLVLHFHHLSKSKIVFGQNPSRVIK